MNSTRFRYGIGAAAALALAFAGWRLMPASHGGNETTPSPLESPTSITAFQMGSMLDAGAYQLSAPGDVASTIQLPKGWTLTTLNGGKVELERRLTNGGPEVPADIRKAYNGGVIGLYVVDDVFKDPCRDTQPVSPAIGPTVDDFVQALRNQKGSVLTSIGDVTIGGRRGKTMRLWNDIDASTCVGDPWLWEWTYPTGQMQGTLGGQHWRVTALDVDGQRLVAVEWIFDWTTDEIGQEMGAIVQSLRFDQAR